MALLQSTVAIGSDVVKTLFGIVKMSAGPSSRALVLAASLGQLDIGALTYCIAADYMITHGNWCIAC